MRIRRELKIAAKNNLYANFQKIALFVLSMFGLIMVATFICISPFLLPAFGLSMVIFFLAIARGKKTTLEMLFAGFHDYWRCLLAVLAIFVGVMLGIFFFAIPGIIFAFAWSQTFFILADDKSISVFDAMRKSSMMMRGHKFDYWALQMSFFGWCLLSAMTFGLGSILLLPYMQLTNTEFYLDLKAEYEELNEKSQVASSKPATKDVVKKTNTKSKANKKK